MTAQNHQDGPVAATTDPLAVFRRPPIALVVFMLVVAAVGVVGFVLNFGKEAVAKCGSDLMAPGDTCTLRSRRGGSSDWTFEQRLGFNVYENLSNAVGGIVVVVLTLIMIAAALIRWRLDIAVADRLAGEQEPVTSFSTSTGVGAGFAGLVSCGAGFFGAMILVRGFWSKSGGVNAVGLALGAAILVGSLVIVWIGRPKGCTLVWAYPSAVRVVTQSKIHDVAWTDMHYLVSGDSRLLSWVGRKSNLIIDDDDFHATMRRHINAAVQSVAAQRIQTSETLDFGAVKVTGTELKVGKKTLNPAGISGVALTRDKNGTYYQFRNQQGGDAATIPVLDFANIDVAFEVLSKQFNIGFLQG